MAGASKSRQRKRAEPRSRRTNRKGPAAGGPSEQLEPGIRLQKLLAQAGIASRRAAEQLITAGRVRVNDRVVTRLGTRVQHRDRVVVDGRELRAERLVYLLMNKPDGVVCSAEGRFDARNRPTVLSLLRGVEGRVYPVGRLDYHSRGALILTNDGELTDLLTHPRHHVPKTYHVKLQGQLDAAVLEHLLAGVRLEDGSMTAPLGELSVVRETKTNTWLQMTLHEGKNQQIRRMGEAIGHSVLKIIRVAIADLTIEGLEDGHYRRLGEAEVAGLRLAAGEPRQPRRGSSRASEGPRQAEGSRQPETHRSSGRRAVRGARKTGGNTRRVGGRSGGPRTRSPG